jgi:hypothetical protein
MLAITSPTSGGRSIGIVRSRTQTMELFFLIFCHDFDPLLRLVDELSAVVPFHGT